MLLEDEVGVINVSCCRPSTSAIAWRCGRPAFVRVDGQLERREGVINVVVDTLEALATPDMPQGKVRHIEPPAEREGGRSFHRWPSPAAEPMAWRRRSPRWRPKPHSFGRRR